MSASGSMPARCSAFVPLPSVEIERSKSVVAGKQELRIADPLGQRQGLLVRGERGCAIAVTLVNLAQDDQRHGEMVDQAEPAVEVDGGLGRRNMSALPRLCCKTRVAFAADLTF